MANVIFKLINDILKIGYEQIKTAQNLGIKLG